MKNDKFEDNKGQHNTTQTIKRLNNTNITENRG